MNRTVFLVCLLTLLSGFASGMAETGPTDQRLYFLSECISHPRKDCNLSFQDAGREALRLLESEASEVAKVAVIRAIFSRVGIHSEPKTTELIISLVSEAYMKSYRHDLIELMDDEELVKIRQFLTKIIKFGRKEGDGYAVTHNESDNINPPTLTITTPGAIAAAKVLIELDRSELVELTQEERRLLIFEFESHVDFLTAYLRGEKRRAANGRGYNWRRWDQYNSPFTSDISGSVRGYWGLRLADARELLVKLGSND